jgi:NAD(P)-dependent dehydrogenase (short-subunit alcohol dehydrogenase family)
MATPSIELFDLHGKIGLVTGAARGLGRAMAKGLAEAGADLLLVDVLEDVLAQTARDIGNETGRKIHHRAVDLGDSDLLEPIVAACTDHFGRLDVLVNNAATTVRKPFAEITPEQFDRILVVNTKAAYFLSQHAARQMIRQGRGGKIVNMASLTSEIGMHNITAYGASKGGVYALTKGLAVELAPYGICVNAIAPGFFVTDLTAPVWDSAEKRAWVQSRIPLGRPGYPEDIVGTVVYLASAASDYLTGRVIFLDGGWMAS